jgi:hypothetical protein
LQAKIYPNPATETATFVFPKMSGCANHFVLTDMQGQAVADEVFCGEIFHFKRKALGNGVYFLSVKNAAQAELWKGKLVLMGR